MNNENEQNALLVHAEVPAFQDEFTRRLSVTYEDRSDDL